MRPAPRGGPFSFSGNIPARCALAGNVTPEKEMPP